MPSDEQEIRELIATWLEASRTHELDVLLDLLTDDVVFLQPGQPPMRKRDFEAASREVPGHPQPAIEPLCEIQEIVVSGDWAYLWTKLSVAVAPVAGSPPTVRAGHTLSVLRKDRGRWRIARDANVLAPVASATTGSPLDARVEG